MTDTSTNREDELINYLESEAEHEIECAQEFTKLAKTLRRMETIARRLANERRALHQHIADDAGELADLRRIFEDMLEVLETSYMKENEK